MLTSQGVELGVASPREQTEDQHGEDEPDGPGIGKSGLVACIVCSPDSSSTERTTQSGKQSFNSKDDEADGQRETDAICSLTRLLPSSPTTASQNRSSLSPSVSMASL